MTLMHQFLICPSSIYNIIMLVDSMVCAYTEDAQLCKNGKT